MTYNNAKMSCHILSNCSFNEHPKFRRYKVINNLGAPRYDKYLTCLSKCGKKCVLIFTVALLSALCLTILMANIKIAHRCKLQMFALQDNATLHVLSFYLCCL